MHSTHRHSPAFNTSQNLSAMNQQECAQIVLKRCVNGPQASVPQSTAAKTNTGIQCIGFVLSKIPHLSYTLYFMIMTSGYLRLPTRLAIASAVRIQLRRY